MYELQRYIVSYIDGYEDERYLYIIMELVEGGDLLDFVQSYGGLRMPCPLLRFNQS